MPELPDVEAYRERLEEEALHRGIAHVGVHADRLLEDVSGSTLRRHLKGRELTGTERHGKWLLARVGDGERWLALHFGMTGDLVPVGEDDEEPRHSRLLLRFEDGGGLAVTSARRLGAIRLERNPRSLVDAKKLGPDALDVDEDAFLERLEGRSAAIKSALMDQHVLAGVGNVWADEVLFHARVDPRSRVDGLDERALRRIHGAMRHVLGKGVERHARVEDLPRGWLIHAREDGAECPGSCGGKVVKSAVGGRSTYHCPTCQEKA